MAKHLDDKTKKKVIAKYIDCGNYSAVAREFKVSVNTVKTIVNSDGETANKCKHKKEQNTKNVLEWLDKRTHKILNKCDLILDSIDKESINAIPVNLRTTAFGTLIDKMLMPYTNKITKVDDDTTFENNRKTFAELIKGNKTVDKHE